MVNLYPISSISANITEGQVGHPGVHNSERTAIQKLNDFVSGMGLAPLDLFAIGGTDSDKLDAAMAYCASIPGGRTPRIALTNRTYNFTRSIGQPYDGFHLEGFGRGQQGSISGTPAATTKQHTTLKIEIPASATGKPGYFINCTSGTARDFFIGGFSAYSDNGITQMYRAPYVAGVSQGFGECTFRDSTFQNFYSVFGNSSEGCSMTICDVDGGWLIFEARDTGFNIQGSDCRNIFGDGADLYNSSAVVAGTSKWMGIFNALGKTRVGPIYITAFEGWRGLKISATAATGLLSMSDAIIEGANAAEQCHGSLIRIEGSGNVAISNTTVNDGMSGPTNTTSPYSNTASSNGNGIADRGLIEIVGTPQVSLTDMCFAHGNGVAMTTPVVYNESPNLMCARFQKFSRNTAWGTQKPVVKGTAPILSDSTMQLVA